MEMAAPTDGIFISVGNILLALLVLGAIVLAVGSMTGNNRAKEPGSSTKSFMRSWIAIMLVVGLIVFSCLPFALDDSTL